jgi:hypothetical protein
MAPMPEAIAFAKDGSYQEQDIGDSKMIFGSYIVQGNNLVLHPAVESEGYFDENFEMTWVGDDKLNLKPIPPDEAKDKIAPEMLEAMTLRMRRQGSAEKLDKDAIAAALDPQGASKKSQPLTEAQTCVSNVRQLSMGMLMYAEDYDQVYPSSEWQTALMPYVRQPASFTCPVVKRLGGSGGYALNDELVGASLSKIKDPASETAIFETPILQPNVVASPLNSGKVGRHPDGDTVGYADGHVKAVP